MDGEGIIASLSNVGAALNSVGRSDEALNYFNRCLKIQ
jgi:hypothetical protein